MYDTKSQFLCFFPDALVLNLTKRTCGWSGNTRIYVPRKGCWCLISALCCWFRFKIMILFKLSNLRLSIKHCVNVCFLNMRKSDIKYGRTYYEYINLSDKVRNLSVRFQLKIVVSSTFKENVHGNPWNMIPANLHRNRYIQLFINNSRFQIPPSAWVLAVLIKEVST